MEKIESALTRFGVRLWKWVRHFKATEQSENPDWWVILVGLYAAHLIQLSLIPKHGKPVVLNKNRRNLMSKSKYFSDIVLSLRL